MAYEIPSLFSLRLPAGKVATFLKKMSIPM